MPLAHCSTPLCSGYSTHGGRCIDCYRKAERERGTSGERGYGNRKRWLSARRTTLKRDPICRCDAGDHGHEPYACMYLSNVADHFPKSRKQLIAEGARDPDDPIHLRGMCRSCHSRETGKHQPGGFAAPR